jgi:integrase
MQLTVKALRPVGHDKSGKPRSDKWLSDGAVRGSGALWARCGASGLSFYFRYTDGEGRKRSVAIGGYDQDGAKGLTLAQARERAGALSKLYRDGIKDLHEHLEREREAAMRARRAEEAAVRAAAEDAQRGTLKQLLDAYVGHLERAGKQSVRDVRNIFRANVFEAAPDLIERKAADLSVDDFVGVIGKLVEAGKGRTADKLRSYLRAAFQLAVESKTNPAAPLALRAYGIDVNPIASIGALSQFNRARDRTLSGPELGALLRRIDALPDGAQRDALHLCIYLGGQRPMQLLRLRPGDVDLAADTVTLYDGKGARSQPRAHVLPLVKEAHAILERRLASTRAGGTPLLSTDGETPMRVETLSVLVADISKEMVKADPAEARETFQLRDLRRTAETMLASLKVSSDIRAQLQSHGLGGVQQRHYDRHDYALEKRQALQKWARHLAALETGETGKVVPIGKAAN